MDDVALKMNMMCRLANRIEPRRVILPRVLEQDDMIATDERSASGSRERVLGECPYRAEGVEIRWV
jgi:hypothetical protein